MGTFQASSSASETSQVKTQQLEECVQLSNVALIYIKMGETAEAHRLLEEAGSIIQKMMTQQEPAMPIDSQLDVDYEHYFEWTDLSSSLPTEDDLAPSPRSFSLFLQGLWIHSGISLSSVSTHVRGLATIRLIVQFNFALSCHLLGTQHFAESRSGVSNYYQQVVCQRYQAIQLALDYFPIIPKSSDLGMLMLAAVLNNQACIYSELDLLDHASFSLVHMPHGS